MIDPISDLVRRAREKLHATSAVPNVAIPGTTRAAVLMPLFADEDGEASVWLLRKSEGRAKHAGQVALPGGKAEPHDESMLETALREAEEEIQLPRRHVEIVGALDPRPTITGFVVTPFVGIVPTDFQPVPDGVEVARAFRAKLATFAEPGTPHEVRVLAWRRTVPAYAIDGEIVWGATAKILQDAAEKLLR